MHSPNCIIEVIEVGECVKFRSDKQASKTIKPLPWHNMYAYLHSGGDSFTREGRMKVEEEKGRRQRQREQQQREAGTTVSAEQARILQAERLKSQNQIPDITTIKKQRIPGNLI